MEKILGLDPSFTGLGMTVINPICKTIKINELSAELNGGSFSHIVEATDSIVKNLLDSLLVNNYNEYIVGMEIPPTQGFYAVKLYALDTQIYRTLIKEFNKDCIYLFGVPYLRFINGKSSKKEDTMEIVGNLMGIFKNHGYEFFQYNENIQKLTEKNSKTLAYFDNIGFTNNQADSFIYAVRMFIKYMVSKELRDLSTEECELVRDILTYKPRFALIKETITGKADPKVKQDIQQYQDKFNITVDYINSNI